jgi:PTS system D-glucosamine-specific IIC component
MGLNVFDKLQRIGRAFMLPIALLPVAGLFLGVGGSFTNSTLIESYHLTALLGDGTVLHDLFKIMAAAGEVVFANLPILFAIGVALAMANHEKATAALAAAVGFFVMHATLGAILEINGWVIAGNAAPGVIAGAITKTVGITTLNMGVFGGIIVGLGVAYLTDRFYNITLPDYLSFFAGTRFIPIITAFVYLLVGILAFYAWPPIQSLISLMGQSLRDLGYVGTFIYGLIERSLIPFGLHHVFYVPFWQTALGGTADVCGKMVEGAQNIFFAELGCSSVTSFNVEATKYMTGKFPFMMFGLPAAALAMYRHALPAKKKIVGGLLFSAAFTAFLTGITEPIEFTFLFVAPILYAIHAVLAGLSFMFMHIFQVGVGQTFSGGFIDFVLYGVIQGNAKTNWIYIPIVGAVYSVVYYCLFSFIIKKYDLKTPGRELEDEVKLFNRADYEAKKQAKHSSQTAATSLDSSTAKAVAADVTPELAQAQLIVDALGGAANLASVENCITRLRISVHQADLIDENLLNQAGALGIIKSGTGVQMIYGPKVTAVKAAVDQYLSL